jgi:hypothetical protein
MAAITENSSTVTEFSGKNKLVVIDLDMSTSTTNTVTVDELSVVTAVVASKKEAPTAACFSVAAFPNATTATNVISVLQYTEAGAACTQTATDVVLFVVGY